ncbi:DUF1593 domain-containing protein [Cecembia rubra]|uniref:DUF1593 domain-containing protein n=1 Tax=Cecembia rubra TaxID=1485585 RepID=UPI002714D76C|nr:DUF1593 domain-containing protein [Cecembia rubra]
MKKIFILVLFSLGFPLFCPQAIAQDKYRVVILSDMTHDDGNSLIRYLYYSPYFDTEAIIVTQQLPDFNFNQDGPWEKVTRILEAYKEEFPQLLKHDPDFPTYNSLKSITKRGRGALPIIWLTNEKKFASEIAGRYVEASWGDIRFHDWIGEGLNPNGESKDSEGSEFLMHIFEKEDDRPIFVQMWGGPITFVQALYRFTQKHGQEKYKQLLGKLHVYGILLQDITFDYLIDLNDVQALKCANLGTVVSTFEGERAEVGWLLHDAGHFWKYLRVMEQREVNGHGPMSEIYDHGGEGDSPAFLYLLSGVLGLNDPLDPTQGSWGSRFQPMGKGFPNGYFHTCGLDQMELERWIPDAKNSFLNRLQYSLKEPNEVNHEPVVIVNGIRDNKPLVISGFPGNVLVLEAAESFDPDGDELEFHWFLYPEASSYRGKIQFSEPNSNTLQIEIPKDISDQEVHLILEVKDNGAPRLVGYKRLILKGI